MSGFLEFLMSNVLKAVATAKKQKSITGVLFLRSLAQLVVFSTSGNVSFSSFGMSRVFDEYGTESLPLTFVDPGEEDSSLLQGATQVFFFFILFH